MNYQECMKVLEEASFKRGIHMGLDSMRDLMAALGDPGLDLPAVHIAGTNGKGAAGAMLTSILAHTSYRVGWYHSPAVYDPWEILCVDGKMISPEEVAEGMTAILDTGIEATAFEMQTALAFWYFEKKHCDLIVLEAGLGGDEDATNVVRGTVCSLIMSVGLDHTGILGDTKEEIARHKAGIVRENIPCVVYPKNDISVLCTIRECCDAVHSKMIPGYIHSPWTPSIPGEHQSVNAGTVLKVAEVLNASGFTIPEEAVREGLREVHFPGRMERLTIDGVTVYLDGAHNPDAVRALVRTLPLINHSGSSNGSEGKNSAPHDHGFICVMGVLEDKNYPQMLQTMLPAVSAFYPITPDHPERALTAEKLYQKAIEEAEELPEAHRPEIMQVRPLRETLEAAITQAKKEERSIIVCGSFYNLALVRGVLNSIRTK